MKKTMTIQGHKVCVEWDNKMNFKQFMDENEQAIYDNVYFYTNSEDYKDGGLYECNTGETIKFCETAFQNYYDEIINQMKDFYLEFVKED